VEVLPGHLHSAGPTSLLATLPPKQVARAKPALGVDHQAARGCVSRVSVSGTRLVSNAYLAGLFTALGAGGAAAARGAPSAAGSAPTVVGATLSPVFTFSRPSTMT